MNAVPGPAAAVRERSAPERVQPPEPSAPPQRAVPGSSPRRRPRTSTTTRTLVALGLLTAGGAALRAHGFSRLGFFRDDAWVAISAHQGLGRAVHMWTSAPGFYFALRAFILIGPRTT